MTDFSKLTKAELLALVEQMQANPPAPAEAPTPASAPAAVVDAQALVAGLMQALRPSEADTKTYRVTNVSGMSVGLETSGIQGGPTRAYSLVKHGDFCMLTRAQIEEIREKYPVMFEKGYLSAPEIVADNPNVILNADKFLADLTFETIEPALDRITSTDTLSRLYHHIENRRFQHADPTTGAPYKEKDADGNDVFVMKELPLAPKQMAVLQSLQRRIAEKTGVRIAINGK